MPAHSRKHHQSFWQTYGSRLLLALLGVVFVVGVIVANFSLQKPQDIRQQASETQQIQVQVKGSQKSGAPHHKKLTFFVNTNAISIDGVQLSFKITNLDSSNFRLTESVDSPLELSSPKISDETDTISFLSLARTLNAYANETFVPFAVLEFETEDRGSAILEFDSLLSSATLTQTFPPVNVLAPLGTLTIDFSLDIADNPLPSGIDSPQGNPTPTPSPSTPPTTPTPTPTPEIIGGQGGFPTLSPTASPTATPTRPPTPRPTSTPSPTPTRRPTSTPTIRPTSVPSPRPTPTQLALANTPTPTPLSARTCNQLCSTNQDCAINLRCYQGACRLAINPTNPACQPASDALQSCNESCQTNNNCEAGLTCYQNRCRNPMHQTSTSCANATPIPTTGSTSTSPVPTPKPTATPRTLAQSASSPTPTSVIDPNSPESYFQPRSSDVVNIFGESPSYQAALNASDSGTTVAETTPTSEETTSTNSQPPILTPSDDTAFFNQSNDVLFGIVGVIVTTIVFLLSLPFLLKLSKKNLTKSFTLAKSLEKPVSPLANFPGRMPGSK